MKKLKKFSLILLLLMLLLFGVLYIAVNSAYVFDKVASYIAPQYGIHYNKVSGNALQGITIEGLYYKEKKLARKVKVKINPVTLLEKRITVSHLTLNEVNEAYLEEMIADFSSDEEDNSSSDFPLSVTVKDIKLSMLPFEISGIKFTQADLRVEFMDYASDSFSFGTLKLMAKNSLGRADIKGHYKGRDLYLSDLYIGHLNTEEIERLFLSDENTSESGTEENSTVKTDTEPSIFIPKRLFVQHLKVTMLPRKIQGIQLSLLTLDGDTLMADLDAEIFSGDMNISAVSDIARAEVALHADDALMDIKNIHIWDINMTKVIALGTKMYKTEGVASEEMAMTTDHQPLIIPYIADKITIGRLEIAALPFAFNGTDINHTLIKGSNFAIDLSQQKLLSGNLDLSVISDIVRVKSTLQLKDALIDIPKLEILDLNISKALSLSTESNDTQSASVSDRNSTVEREAFTFPYVLAEKINIGALGIEALPFVISGIEINSTAIKGSYFSIDMGSEMLVSGKLLVDIQSNLASLHHEGRIKQNRLLSHAKITLYDALIQQYDLPIRKGALKTILLQAVTDMNQTKVNIGFEAERLLDTGKGAFNIGVKHSNIMLDYKFASTELQAIIDSNLTTPNTEHAQLHVGLTYQDTLRYKGILSSPVINAVDPKIASLLKDLKIKFEGSEKKISARISTKEIQGDLNHCDFKQCTLHAILNDNFDVNKFVKLPRQLQETKVKFSAAIPVDFAHLMPLNAQIKLLSNVLNMDAHIMYDKGVVLKAKVIIPPETLLKNFDQKIKFASLSPMNITMGLKEDLLTADIQAQKLKVSAEYGLRDTAIQGSISLAGTRVNIVGKSIQEMKITQSAKSIQSLLKAVNNIYSVDLPDLRGDISLQGNINNLSSVSLKLKSREILLGKDRKSAIKFSNLRLTASGDAKGVTIPSYAVETAGVKLFANKRSKIEIKGDKITVSPLWVNDAMKITGTYDLKQKKGILTSNALKLKISHEMADLITALHLKTTVNGEKISLKGKVHLDGGSVKYDMQKKSFAADSDIIILQRQKKADNSFRKNFNINLTMDSRRPLKYEQKGIYVEMIPRLSVTKGYGKALKIHGSITLLPGGYYTFQNKKFILKKSSIKFKGRPTAPILNINIVYYHAGTTISVKVSGTASEPSLNFSSDPHMSREEILSFIMFDTSRGGGENKAGDVTNLVAGTLVKSLFSNMGLKLDHLVLTGSGFEVGKKISDRITIIYNQEERSSIKVRIENSRNIETDISFGTNSRSADIFYKREF